MENLEVSKITKSEIVVIRLSKKEKAVLRQKAALYTKGNLSHWIRAALQNYIPNLKNLDYK